MNGMPQTHSRSPVLRRGGTAIEHRQYQGMLQPGGGLDLPKEPFGTEHVRQLGAEDLYRHVAVVPKVTRQVDNCHPTPAELALDPVATVKGLGHVGLLV